MGLRATQLGLLCASLFCIWDLYLDVLLIWDFAAHGAWRWCVVQIFIVLASGFAQAVFLVGSTLPARFFLTTLRLTVFLDTCQVFSRPSYQTLHPLYARPFSICLDAVLKVVPTCLLHTYLALSTDFTLGHYHEFFRACISIAWAVAACEIGDFKHRQLLDPVCYSSLRFLRLFVFRLAEVSGRVVCLVLLATAVTPWALVTYLLVDLTLLAILASLPESHPANPLHVPAWQYVVFFCIYWDIKLDRTGATLLRPSSYVLLRLVGQTMALVVALTASLHSAGIVEVMLYASAMLSGVVMGVLFPSVNRMYWHLCVKIHGVATTPVCSPPRKIPRTAQLSSPRRSALMRELVASPWMYRRRGEHP